MKCITENCSEIISQLSKLDMCPKCRANIGGWRKRSPADVLKRRKNLSMYADRMSHVSAGKMTDNVVQFKDYSKKKPATVRMKGRQRVRR
jgi:Zn-finger nucleic acid-binding protein